MHALKKQLSLLASGLIALLLPGPSAGAANLTGSLATIPAGTDVNLTVEGPVDWVHWGLYTDSSLDRKAGVTPLISDFSRLDATNGYSYIYQFGDNYNGYTWSDGSPTTAVTNTTTGVWAYGIPAVDSGFQLTAAADTTLRTLKVYVGAFSARGKFEALLSDNSAPGYTNTALVNQGNGESGVYSITYAADSPGQTLTVQWTLMEIGGPNAGTANVTLQAAALLVPGANNPPIVTITSPGDDNTFVAGSNITINANAFDTDTDTNGTIATVEFFQRGIKLGESTNSPYNLVWSNVSAGRYVLTAKATDNGGATSTSGPVEIFVNTTGGALSGSTAFPPANAVLTDQGTSDWAHWGLLSATSFDHKSGVPQQISNFTKIGANNAQQYANYYTAFSWSDGTPTAATNDTATGVFTYGPTNGFRLTAPADTNSRTLKVYVGLYGAQGKFQAALSDFSAPAYTDTSLNSIYGNVYAVYTLNYAAASAGRTLTIQYTAKTLYDADYGNVTLQAATLSGGLVPTNVPPAVAIISPTNNTTFTAPANITIVADPTDTDGTISLVEFFQNSIKLGEATNSPYSFAWTNVTAGNYTLTARATDNLGAATVSSPVSVSVTSNAPPAVVIQNPGAGGGTFHFSFATQSGVTYTVQFTDSFNPVNWQEATNFTGNGTTVTVTNTMTSAERFYRVRAQ